MSAEDHLGTYAEGWTKGDADIILSSVTEDYTFDNPNAGVIPKSDIVPYLAGLKETVASLCGGDLPDPFMELTEVITSDRETHRDIYGRLRKFKSLR